MFSAVVVALDAGVRVSASSEAIVRTLAALVPAAIDGLIRDVTLATLPNAPQAHEIADHAGCALTQGANAREVLAAGVASTRCELVFVILAGRAPEAGFIDEIQDLFSVAPDRAPRSAILRAAPATFLSRLFPALCAVEALILRKSDYVAGVTDFTALHRGLVSPLPLRSRLRRVV